MSRSALIPLLALVLCLPLVTSLPLRAWPDRTLLVYDDASTQRVALAEAIEGWNRADAGIRFRLVDRRERADVVVRGFDRLEDMRRWCTAARPINPFPDTGSYSACVDWQGYKPWGPTRLGVFSSKVSDGEPRLIAHELGHVAGVGHEPGGCTVMTRSLGDEPECFSSIEPRERLVVEPCREGPRDRLLDCRITRRSAIACGPGLDDVERARRMYGHEASGRPWRPWCDDDEVLATDGLHDVLADELVMKRSAWSEGLRRVHPLAIARGGLCRERVSADVPIMTEPAPERMRRLCGTRRISAGVTHDWFVAAALGSISLPVHE